MKKPTVKQLIDATLEWWSYHEYDTYSTGDDDEDNVYHEEPKFVTIAKQLKKDLT